QHVAFLSSATGNPFSSVAVGAGKHLENRKDTAWQAAPPSSRATSEPIQRCTMAAHILPNACRARREVGMTARVALTPATAVRWHSLLSRLTLIARKYPNTVLASSLAVEDMVLTHAIFSERLPIEVFTLDTGRLH